MREALIHKHAANHRVLSLTMHAWSKCGYLTDVDLLTDDWDKTICKNCLNSRPADGSTPCQGGQEENDDGIVR